MKSMTYRHSLKGVRHFNKPKEGYKMNSTIDKFVKRATTCVREAKISIRHTGNANLDDLMNRCAEAAERIQKLASRGAEFEEHREIGLEKVWECLLELQEMEMSTSTVWSELKPSEMTSIEEAEKTDSLLRNDPVDELPEVISHEGAL